MPAPSSQQAGYTVAGCGAIALDRVLYLDRGISSGKARVVREELVHGGNVATALAAVVGLGGSGRWLGYLPGGAVADELARLGLDLRFAAPTSTPPIRSTILVDPDGERFIAFDDDTLLGPDPACPGEGLDNVDVLLVDTYVANPQGLRLLDAARRRGVPTIADIEFAFTPQTREFMEAIDHLVVSFEFAGKATGTDSPDAAATSLWHSERTAVVVTNGAHGAWFRSKDARGHVPAFDVPVVDTNGCGDVFHGVYALRIAQGNDVEEAVTAAAAGAAVAATAPGGRGHLPTGQDLINLLASRTYSPRHGAGP